MVCIYDYDYRKYFGFTIRIGIELFLCFQVGYGDIIPTNGQSQGLAVFSALCGILVFGLPIPLIVQGFSTFYGVVNNKNSRVLVTAKELALEKSEACVNKPNVTKCK